VLAGAIGFVAVELNVNLFEQPVASHLTTRFKRRQAQLSQWERIRE
jgi:hypothetical protein